MKNVYGGFALTSFIGTLYACKAVETETVNIWHGFALIALCIVLFALFGWLAGATQPPRDRKE